MLKFGLSGILTLITNIPHQLAEHRTHFRVEMQNWPPAPVQLT